MDRDPSFYTERTIASWDEAAPIHRQINSDLVAKVASPAFNALEPDFDTLVSEFDLQGKSVVQVCCNNGKDLLSIGKKGAGRCLGIDGSRLFIEQARELASAAGHPQMEFACCDIYQLPERYRGSFDFAVITVGVLNWMPDLCRFIQICASLLKPGGRLLMEEIHPVLNMYEEGEPSHIAQSYFDRRPYRDDGGLDYFTGRKYQARENYYFQHTLSDILTAAISTDLALCSFRELGKNVGNYCADLERTECVPPMAFVASWQKSS
ncbi:class I SAM-dependent methyltransferase [Microbulbifer taiwanensis]|uniref:Class I SAM-dependent methyltransferase n=1 Tax=Microbulbifer taiwanensis TaxID=986746 RepID=A0ABW1YHG9_9GAMM|nr:class I SAM-dependent methyltransferase [Microbulbifer taiwanensis]